VKKYLITLLLAIFIIPSVALASWWNPFSWFNNWNFNKKEIPIVQQEPPKQEKEVNTSNPDNNESIVKQERTELPSINNLVGANISASKLNYIKGDTIVINIELPEDKFSSCKFILIDPKGNDVPMGEGGCVAGIRTDFDSRYMEEPIDSYVPKGELMSFLSSGISDGVEYGRLGDNFGIWKMIVNLEKGTETVGVLETKFDYEKDSSMFKQVILNNVAPSIKKVIREELIKFDGSNGVFTAQSYGLTSINVYVSKRGGDIADGYILKSMTLKNKDSNGLQTWTLSAYIKIGDDSPIKLGTYPAGTSIFAVGYAGNGIDKKETNRIYYPYKDNDDIDKNLY